MQERTGAGASRVKYGINNKTASDNYRKFDNEDVVMRGELRVTSSWQKFNTDTSGVHPTVKPVALMEYLIKTYTHPGELVLDNTMGSGTTGVACMNTGRRFIGIERDEKYFEIAEKRIKVAWEVMSLWKPFTLLRPQEIIVDHLRNVDNALVFAGMGISKTAACLYRLTELLLNGESVAALVVAPMRVASLTWPAEARDWLPFTWLRVANLRTEAGQRDFLQGRAHLYLINYESLHHLVSLVERRRGDLPYDITIFDESTRAKNPDSKRINTFRRKVPRTQRNWLLTGTPIPNSNLDIFAQARLCDGGERLGRNYLAFKKEYFMQPSYPFAPWKEKSWAKEAIEHKISDLTVTLKSSDWLNLPDTIFEDIEVHFPAELMEKYQLLEKELVLELNQGQTLNVANAAALVTKLLQFTAGSVYDENKEVHAVHDLKFNALARIAKDEKKPLFVLCIFQHEQSRIRSLFPQAQFFADAKTEKAQRDLLERWNAGKVPMLVAHPASVGHGLNLQYGSSVMVWTSLTYSRENYEQSIARLVRRGQKDPVKVYRLIVPHTVDDAVAEALASKAENEARLISALQMLESFRSQGNQKP